MNNSHSSINRTKKKNQEELEDLVLKGNCPYCHCPQVIYKEYRTYQRFGFECQGCQWKGKYKWKDFNEFAENYPSVRSS